MLRIVVPVLLFGIAAAIGPAQAGVEAHVDKASQRMTVLVDGKPRHVWPVSTGMKGYATPVGSFRPFRAAVEHYSKEWDDAPMPHAIFFTSGGHAIHGSTAVRRLGSPASHGCIRLAPGKAAALFALVKRHGLANTRIVIGGREPTMVARRSVRGPATVARRSGAVLLAEEDLEW